MAYAIFPWYVWSSVRDELPFVRVRLANRWLPERRRKISQLQKHDHLNLHLGCGERITTGWVNVDAFVGDGVDLVWDLRRPLPFHSGTASMIYAEHFLEHLHYEEALAFMADCYRLLQPGGLIRLGVPDAEIYIRAYASGDRQFFTDLRKLGGSARCLETPMDVINQMFRMGGHHRFAWDYETLARAMTETGFQRVTRWDSGEASVEAICLDDPAHAFETLYVEGNKTGQKR